MYSSCHTKADFTLASSLTADNNAIVNQTTMKCARSNNVVCDVSLENLDADIAAVDRE